MRVLVTDGDSRAALAVTRSLGRAGHKVYVLGPMSGNLAAASRYCHQVLSCADPLTQGHHYQQQILRALQAHAIECLLPITEQSIYLINQIREEVPDRVNLACAPAGLMEQVSDKYQLFQTAQSLGVAMPKTVFIADRDDFLARAKEIQKFPVVVKPALSKRLLNGQIRSCRVMFAHSADALKQLYLEQDVLDFPSLIQEMIVGEGTGLFTLFDGQRHRVLFAHRRLLEKPPSGGVSVLSESVPLDSEMVKAAEILLREVGWKGVAMVEFKRDDRDGQAKLMEINGRFWGSLQLSISSGVDFPNLLLSYEQNQLPVSCQQDFRIGQRLKWGLGLLDHFLIRLKAKLRRDPLPPMELSLFQVSRELLRGQGEGLSDDVFSWEDPKPFQVELKAYLKNLFTR